MGGMNREPVNTRHYHVPSLGRALQILEYLAQTPEGFTITDIANALQLPKNSVFRILGTLAAHEYLLREEHTQRFHLSGKFLGLAYRGTASELLLKAAGTILRNLRDETGETALLGCLTDGRGVVLDQEPSRHPIKVQVAPGTRFPLHTAAPAKAILAWLPELERLKILAAMAWPRFTVRTITRRRPFDAELRQVRERGFATDYGEELDGINCVAAPVMDHRGYPVAALWITGPEPRLKPGMIQKAGQTVVRWALALSRGIGHIADGRLGRTLGLLTLATWIGAAHAGELTFAPTLNTQVMTGGVSLKDGGTDVIAVGVHTDGSSGPIRSFLQFDLSSVPATATVSTARFTFMTQNNTGNLPAILTLVRLNTTNVMSTAVTWTKIHATVNWSTPGGDIGTVLGTLTPTWSNAAIYTFPSNAALLSAVQDAISNRAGILQMLVYSPEHEAAHPVPQTTGGFLRIYARNTSFPQALILTSSVGGGGGGETNAVDPWFGVDYHDIANVQSGFVNGGTVTAGAISNLPANPFGEDGNLTTMLTASSGNMQVRIRTDIGNTTSNALLRDLVFALNGDLVLRLQGLETRSYHFTAWFNDSGGGIPNGLDGDYEAVLNGTVMDTWAATYTLNAATGIGTCDFTFDGVQGSDTVININNTTAGKHAMINGFRLIQPPRKLLGSLFMIQ